MKLWLLHYWTCLCAIAAYLRRRAAEKSSIVAFFGGAPLMYAAPTPFWQGFVGIGVLLGVLLPEPPKTPCDEH